MPPTPSPGLRPPARVLRDRRARPRPTPGDVLSMEADRPWHEALRRHWPEYAIEATHLALFVLASGLLSALVERLPGEPDPVSRRLVLGIAAGALVAALVYSPWGRRSGSHLNPAITLAYARLGKMGAADAAAYVVAQVTGALAGVTLLRALLRALPPPPVTLPPPLAPTSAAGEAATALLEFVLAGATMLLILVTSNHTRWFRATGLLYAVLMAGLTMLLPPLSDFGLNPARLLAVDATAGTVDGHWLHLLPPLLGMLLAVDAHRLFTRRQQVLCAKIAHNTHGRCIFRCQHPQQARALAIESIRRRGRDRRKRAA